MQVADLGMVNSQNFRVCWRRALRNFARIAICENERKRGRLESASLPSGRVDAIRYKASLITNGLKGFVLYPLQLIARLELPTKVTVSPMICVQLEFELAPPAKVIAPVGT